MNLGFAGAGRMGDPMVRRLLAAGHPVTVLTRSPDTHQDLAAAGAEVTADVTALANAVAVAVCVLKDEQVRSVCLDGGLLDAMAPGSVLIVHTTCSPRTVDLLGKHAEARDITVVDAAVSGGPHDIAAGRLTVYAGGTDDAVRLVRPILAAYADPILHVGGRGAGQQVKLLNNAVFAANIGIVAQVVAVAAQLGIAEPGLLEALSAGSGASRALQGIAAAGSVAGFTARIGEFISKDLTVVRQAAADLGVDLGALDDAHRVLDGLLAEPDHSTS
jgi:3-hydroxyisobutyrate dehydrogenase-like beta-hydroxyacid dehydrogenase